MFCFKFLGIALLASVLKANPKNDPAEVFKFKTQLNGYSGYYNQNFSEYPIKNEKGTGIIREHIFEFITMPKEKVIRFMTIETWPYLFIKRDANGFKCWGPLYSIVQEAANLINYR